VTVNDDDSWCNKLQLYVSSALWHLVRHPARKKRVLSAGLALLEQLRKKGRVKRKKQKQQLIVLAAFVVEAVVKCTDSDNDGRWAKIFRTLYLFVGLSKTPCTYTLDFLHTLRDVSYTSFTTVRMNNWTVHWIRISGIFVWKYIYIYIYVGPRQHSTMGNEQYRWLTRHEADTHSRS